MVFQVLCRSSHTTHSGSSVQMVRCEDAAYSFHHLPQMTQCSILRRLSSYCAGPIPLLAQMNIPTALRHACGERRAEGEGDGGEGGADGVSHCSFL